MPSLTSPRTPEEDHHDILAVINGFGTAGNDPLLDRSPAPPGSRPWLQGPPDGTIDLMTDILGGVSQFGHRCAGPQ